MFGIFQLDSTRAIFLIYFLVFFFRIYLSGIHIPSNFDFRKLEPFFIALDSVMFVGMLSVPVPTSIAYKLYLAGLGYLFFFDLLKRINELKNQR